jgi:hypothetical protein
MYTIACCCAVILVYSKEEQLAKAKAMSAMQERRVYAHQCINFLSHKHTVLQHAIQRATLFQSAAGSECGVCRDSSATYCVIAAYTLILDHLCCVHTC